MARRKGTLSLSSNLNVLAAAPLDARELVETTADMIDPNSWDYTFVGMKCYNKESQKWYTLRYEDPTNIDNWVEIGTGKDGLDGKPIMLEGTEKVGRENIITLVWTDIHGADHSQDVVILDGAAGPQGPEGPQGPAGQSFSLHSQYDSYEELIAEHPTGSDGEAYFVASETEGAAPDVYVWMTDTEEWYNQGPITGIAGPKGENGFSPDVVVAENSNGVYKLRITTSTGSFVTPNLRGLDGNHAPQDKIDDSTEPVQSKTIKTALDGKQDKTLVSSVGVRDYATKNIVNQTTVQAALEALAAAINYMEIPNQMIAKVSSVEDLPANAKPGSICIVEDEDDNVSVYIYEENDGWTLLVGSSGDMVEISNSEIDDIWEGNSTNSGGNSSTTPTEDVQTNLTWTSSRILPESLGDFVACVYDGKINVLGGKITKGPNANSYSNKHYQFNDGEWELASTLPYAFSGASCVVYNDKIYLIGGNTKPKNFYSWDGTEWKNEGNLPYDFSYGGAVVYNDEIHILGGKTTNMQVQFKNHYKWNGTGWTSVSTLPNYFYKGIAIVDASGIHLIGGELYGYEGKGAGNHYVWDGTSWSQNAALIETANDPATIYNGKINLFVDSYRYELVDNKWIKRETYYGDCKFGQAVVIDDHIHIISGSHYVSQ